MSTNSSYESLRRRSSAATSPPTPVSSRRTSARPSACRVRGAHGADPARAGRPRRTRAAPRSACARSRRGGGRDPRGPRSPRRTGGRQTAARIDEDGAARVKACLARHGELLEAGDRRRLGRERRPSRDLLELSGHRTALRLIYALSSQTVRYQYRTILIPGRSAASVAEHGAIVDAVVAGRPTRPRRRCGAISSTWPSPCGAGCSRGIDSASRGCRTRACRARPRGQERSTSGVVRPPGIVDNIGADLVDSNMREPGWPSESRSRSRGPCLDDEFTSHVEGES